MAYNGPKGLKNAYEMEKCANPKCGHVDGYHDGLHGKCFELGDYRAPGQGAGVPSRCPCQKFERSYERKNSPETTDGAFNIVEESGPVSSVQSVPDAGNAIAVVERKNADAPSRGKCEWCSDPDAPKKKRSDGSIVYQCGKCAENIPLDKTPGPRKNAESPKDLEAFKAWFKENLPHTSFPDPGTSQFSTLLKEFREKTGGEKRNAGHLGPETWLASSTDERAEWLSEAGADINLSIKESWDDLSEDVKIGLQEVVDKPASQNNEEALESPERGGHNGVVEDGGAGNLENARDFRCSCGGKITKTGDDEFECDDCGALYETDDWRPDKLKPRNNEGNLENGLDNAENKGKCPGCSGIMSKIDEGGGNFHWWCDNCAKTVERYNSESPNPFERKNAGVARGASRYGATPPLKNSNETLLGRWESGRGKDWVELLKVTGIGGLAPDPAYKYRGRQSGGWIEASNDREALDKFEREQMRYAFNDDAKQIKRVK